ncbi:N-acetylmuramoyl-L-alanine amidase [Pseudonocardia broussonetiae]|uniref:N-acetylmuramoyl-L-alanine amidase n=1 Tax=Pseudonocardia broussonetiae TaxID=2736640 RepID=A0A6M6JV72_9PSEU|nr:N-acetylmuramoyl-L-alanine amidase [Pseudonocardia broussonetiae]
MGCGSPAAPAPAATTTPATTTTATATATATTVRATSTLPAPPQRVVVLDPGHNGGNGTHPAEIGRPVPDGRSGTKACNTTGTATDAGYPEHAFTWDVAQRVRRALEADGVRVVLTRPDDTGVGPCVDERGRAGEAAGADAVVSIHADGAAPGGSGFHVALSDPPLHPAQGAPARELALAVRDALRTGGFTDSDYTGEQALTPRPDLAGLNHSTRPAVLVECANMRNAAEAALVSSEAGRERYAEAIAAGILTYLG